MPEPQTYEVTAPDGRVFELSAEGGPPSEQELEDVFKHLDDGKTPAVKAATAAAPTWDQRLRESAKQATDLYISTPIDLVKGAAAGVASTVFHGGDLLRRMTGMERVIDRPEVQAAMTAPATMAGGAGKLLEQGAEFAIPLSRVAKGVSTLGRLGRWGIEGAAGAGIAGVQSGGDPNQMAAAAVAPPIGAGLGKVGGMALQATRRAAAGAAEGGLGGAVASAIRTTAALPPVQMLVSALKPRNTRTNFPQLLETALPEIKAVERETGQRITNIDEFIDATQEAKRRIWAAWEMAAGPKRAMGSVVQGDPIADGIEQSIPSRTLRQDPRAADAVRQVADSYRQDLPLQDAEQLLKETNAALEAYYNKFPAARRAAETVNPEIAHLLAEAKGLRAGINKTIDAEGEGAAARELKRRYGALSEIEDTAQRRSMVAMRQQPESLSEQIGKVRAAGEIAKGVFRIAHGDLMGAGNIAAARAQSEAATFLKQQNTTNALIRRAMAAHQTLPTPVPPIEQAVIRGLLPPGTTRLGPATVGGVEPSDVPGITQRGQYGEPVQFRPEQRALPTPAIQLGPAPEPPMAVRGEYGAKWTPPEPTPEPPPAPPAPVVSSEPVPAAAKVVTPRAPRVAKPKAAPTPAPTPIQSDPHYVKGTASKAAAVVKPVAPTAPVAEPEQAAEKIAQRLERVIDVSGAKSAGDVRQRVIAGLEKELAGAQQDAGFAKVDVKRNIKGKTIDVYLDGKPVVSVNTNKPYPGQVRVLTDDLQGFTDTKGKTTYEGPESLKKLQAEKMQLADLKDMGLSVAAAFGRAKGAGQVVMRIPGDGVFTVERNPHAIQLLLDKIKKSSPQIWKDLVKK